MHGINTMDQSCMSSSIESQSWLNAYQFINLKFPSAIFPSPIIAHLSILKALHMAQVTINLPESYKHLGLHPILLFLNATS